MSGKNSKVLRRMAKEMIAPGSQERAYEQQIDTTSGLTRKIDSKGRTYFGRGSKTTKQVKLGYCERRLAKQLKRNVKGFTRLRAEGE